MNFDGLYFGLTLYAGLLLGIKTEFYCKTSEQVNKDGVDVFFVQLVDKSEDANQTGIQIWFPFIYFELIIDHKDNNNLAL